jgi:hypothetical protein
MVYVQRENGAIAGVYRNLQEGIAEEELADDNTEVLAFFNPPAPPVESVSARQFKMQLVIAGIKSQVDAWISQQGELVRIAYEYSGTFVRNEPMMATGFAAMGFTLEQIDEFFLAASKL